MRLGVNGDQYTYTLNVTQILARLKHGDVNSVMDLYIYRWERLWRCFPLHCTHVVGRVNVFHKIEGLFYSNISLIPFLEQGYLETSALCLYISIIAMYICTYLRANHYYIFLMFFIIIFQNVTIKIYLS